MKLNEKTYKDKVLACYMGKNMGGTLGGPFEGVRTTLDLQGFTTKKGEVLPNDDLDLQLVWLHAVKFEGARHITADVLGEYWLSFITGYWNEYGIARRNMEKGVLPPLCGEVQNEWKHSNGAWIRTEVWAALAPAYPDLAVRFAIEDAKVDHGTGEGTYAAAFVAALESAAFVVQDVRKLLEIGLAKIPADCRTARSVRLVQTLFDEGKTWQQTREAILKENKDIGDGWFQAPSNVAYVVLGLLYGGGDFKKSMLTAVNCGDDTDCTAGTVGAILGLMYGTAGLPEDWCAYIGDEIVTGTLNMCISMPRIKSCKQLADEIARLAPVVLLQNGMNAPCVEITNGKTEYTAEETEKFLLPYGACEESDAMRASLCSLLPNSFTARFAYGTAIVRVDGDLCIGAGEEKKIYVRVVNNVKALGNLPHTVRVRLYLPEGFTADKTELDIFVPHWTPLTPDCTSEEICLTVRAPETVRAENTVLLHMCAAGRYTACYLPVVFTVR